MARRRIEIEVLVDPALAQKGFRQTGAAAKMFGHDVERAGRGVAAASLSFKGLGRSVAFASGAFLGGAGLVSAFKSTVSAAEESQRVLGQTQNSLKRAGLAWADYGKQIEKTTLKQSQMSGFDDERLSATFSKFVLKTKDVTKALRDNALAANIARSRNIELEAAAQLVMKAELGQSGALRRVGIDAAKNATSTQLLQMLNQKFAGSAAAYANTAAGAQDRFRVALENFQEVLGARALPTIAKYLNQGADWLNDTKNQKRVNDELSTALGLLKDTIAALTPFVKAGASAAEDFSGAVGGARNALKLLIATAAGWKVLGLVSKFSAISAAAGEAGAAGSIGLLRGRMLALRAIGPIALGVTIGIAVKYAVDKTGLPKGPSGIQIAKWVDKQMGWSEAVKGIAGDLGFGGGKPSDMSGSGDTGGGGSFGFAPKSKFFFGGNPSGPVSSNATSGSASAPIPLMGMAAISRQQRNELALAQARTPGEQLAALAEQRAILGNKIAAVRGRLSHAHGKQAKQLADELAGFLQDDAAALDQITSINEAAARDAQQAADKTRDAAKKRMQALMDSVSYSLGVAVDRQGPLGGLEPLTLKEVNDAITKNEQAARAKKLAKAQRDQFRALGLSPTGDTLTPFVSTLKRRAEQIKRAIAGTPLDTNKNRNLLAQITSVLSGQNKKLGRVTEETRRRIKDLLDAMTPKDENRVTFKGSGLLNPNALTKGLGLTNEQARALRQRIIAQHVGVPIPAGGGGTVIHMHISSNSDNPRQVARETISALTKERGRRAAKVRGPRAGNVFGW